jgi:hypothetical protein
MSPKPLRAHKIRQIVLLCIANNVSQTEAAERLRISRGSVRKYVTAFKASALTVSELNNVGHVELATRLYPNVGHLTRLCGQT